jgi:hypothetical protein
MHVPICWVVCIVLKSLLLPVIIVEVVIIMTTHTMCTGNNIPNRRNRRSSSYTGSYTAHRCSITSAFATRLLHAVMSVRVVIIMRTHTRGTENNRS